MKVYEEDPACDQTIGEYIEQEATLMMYCVRELLRKEEMSFGIACPQRICFPVRERIDNKYLPMLS